MKYYLSFVLIFSLFSFFVKSGNARDNDQAKSQFKVRALWVDPPGFKDKETINSLVEMCKKAGINTIFPDIMLRDDIWFKSENFIGNVNANDEFDPLKYLIDKAHAAGIEVHPWSCTYYTKPKKTEWISKPFIVDNYDHVFLSAAHPEVNPYLLSVLNDLLKYDIDGIHLDYTRYWNAAFDYSDAACHRFQTLFGFNPQDFVDHPERIIPESQNEYPIRVLCPNKSTIPVMGIIERTMNRTSYGYSIVTEQVANIDKLRAPGLLIACYYNPSDAIIEALEKYTNRGGDIIWIEPNNQILEKSTKLTSLLGISSVASLKTNELNILFDDKKWTEQDKRTLQVKNISGSYLILNNAKMFANLSTGEPVASVYKNKHNGQAVTIGFRLMHNESEEMMSFLRDIITRLRKDKGINKPDNMAEKRKQWIEWRKFCINEFVQDIHKMVKMKNPKLQVTTAAGVGPEQLYGVYRDGKEWLAEGIVDYIFPMNYTENIDNLKDIIDEQITQTPSNCSDKVYPGLKLYTSKNGKTIPMDANIVDEQLKVIKEYGYKGFCLFAYSYFSDEIIEIVNKYSK